jgi:hypothetical protein
VVTTDLRGIYNVILIVGGRGSQNNWRGFYTAVSVEEVRLFAASSQLLALGFACPVAGEQSRIVAARKDFDLY